MREPVALNRRGIELERRGRRQTNGGKLNAMASAQVGVDLEQSPPLPETPRPPPLPPDCALGSLIPVQLRKLKGGTEDGYL